MQIYEFCNYTLCEMSVTDIVNGLQAFVNIFDLYSYIIICLDYLRFIEVYNHIFNWIHTHLYLMTATCIHA